MENHLKVAKVSSIQSLHAQGWSQRRIARELGIHRATVSRQLKVAAKPTKATPELADPKPAKAPTGSDAEPKDEKAISD